MSVSEQANCDSSEISRFLDYRLPQLGSVARSWEEQVATGPDINHVGTDEPRVIGHAIELRIGLDLTDNPVRTTLLKWLPPERRRFVLHASGIQVCEELADGVAPGQEQWRRIGKPERLDEAQQIVLDACQTLGAVVYLLHTDSVFRHVAECNIHNLQYSESDEADIIAPEMLRRSWQLYLERGRKQFEALGERSQVAPVIAKGFAVGDLVQGDTLIDIKAEKHPRARMLPKLRQVVAYALLDNTDRFGIRSVGIYSAFQGLLMSNPLESILAASTRGVTPQLVELRESLHNRMLSDLTQAGKYARAIIW